MGKNILVGRRLSLVFVYAQSRLGNSDIFLAGGSAVVKAERGVRRASQRRCARGGGGGSAH